MEVGLGVLRLSPATLWAMTPREFAAAIGWLVPATNFPSRGELAGLMRSFPDSRRPSA